MVRHTAGLLALQKTIALTSLFKFDDPCRTVLHIWDIVILNKGQKYMYLLFLWHDMCIPDVN